ncbi:MAG: hypothetical protein Ct9H300mP11_08560 [Chloroflexota bacterium]|nr:MAG: hypothetical protein Ct9H300mP11_08560 [Chloroflexota bacterium]
MVKKAMSLAIDRQTIVDELLSGFGNPIALRDWMGHEGKADPRWNFPYDPETAKQLLVDAGYPDGFSITLTPAIRGAPAETEACEAVAQYWEDIGINVNIQKVPYATIRPTLITRQYQGVTCHTVGPRLTPIIGAGNYVNSRRLAIKTEHPWLQEKVTIASNKSIRSNLLSKRKKFTTGFTITSWVRTICLRRNRAQMGPKLDPDFTPFSYSETRLPNSFE